MNRKAILTVVGVFVLGMLVGGLAIHLAESRVFGVGPRGARGGPGEVVKHLTTELSLDPAQQEQLTSILEETRTRYVKLYEPIRPEHERIRQEGRVRIRAILKPEQIDKYNEFLRQLDEKQKRNNKKNGR